MAIWACAVAEAPPISSASDTVLKRDLIFIVGFLRSFVEVYLVSPVPASMRERVEFPVGLDLAPAMREPIGLEHQKRDDDQPDRHLAQEGYVGVEGQCLVDSAAFQSHAAP